MLKEGKVDLITAVLPFGLDPELLATSRSLFTQDEAMGRSQMIIRVARDGFLPPRVFAAIHPRFRTPHISTMLVGAVICVVAAFTPITKLEEMVNIGTLLAFVMVIGVLVGTYSSIYIAAPLLLMFGEGKHEEPATPGAKTPAAMTPQATV